MSPDYHWKAYVNKSGRAQLAQEFRSDSIFQTVVCPFLKQYETQEQKNVATAVLQDVLSLFEGNLLSIELDLIVGAILDACGYSDLGSKLLKVTVGAIILVALISIIFGQE